MEKVNLDYQKNCRDIGGLNTKDGKMIKYGKLYRSGHLHRVSDNDINKLNELKLTDIIDFRSNKEFVAKGDVRLFNVTYNNFPALEDDHSSQEKNASDDSNLLYFMKEESDGHKYMCKMYSTLVSSSAGIKAYQDFFNLLVSNENKVVLWHCSQGKDRAGIAAFLLEYALGVSYEDCIADYFETNIAMKQKIYEILKRSSKSGKNYDLDTLIDIFSAKKEYLECAIKTIKEKYGTIDCYLINILNIDIEKLRKIYLV